jgi:hypothetical protein
LIGQFVNTRDAALCQRHGIEGDSCLVMKIDLRLATVPEHH